MDEVIVLSFVLTSFVTLTLSWKFIATGNQTHRYLKYHVDFSGSKIVGNILGSRFETFSCANVKYIHIYTHL